MMMLTVVVRRSSSKIFQATVHGALRQSFTKTQISRTWLHTSCFHAGPPTVHRTKFGTVITESRASDGCNKTPVVAILGWNNSKEQHLAKYSAIFEEMGFCTVCIPASPINTFFRAGTKVKEISHHILDTLLKLGCEQRPVFLYAFSNGGCVLFWQIDEALNTPNQPYFKALTVAGTIFDSCPVVPRIENVKIVQETVTNTIKNPILKSLTWYSLGASVSLVVYFGSTVKRFIPALTSSPLRCPQLMFYSKADVFSPYKDIDKYVTARKDLGVRVTSKCWEDSVHVSHYRKHEDEYLKLLNTFIDECLISTAK